MKTFQIAIYVFIPTAILLSGCGRKLPPKPAEGSQITFPQPYPKPAADETPPPKPKSTKSKKQKKMSD